MDLSKKEKRAISKARMAKKRKEKGRIKNLMTAGLCEFDGEIEIVPVIEARRIGGARGGTHGWKGGRKGGGDGADGWKGKEFGVEGKEFGWMGRSMGSREHLE